MTDQRHYGPEEYRKIEGAPLPPARLAQIWAGLPEAERFPFVLALSEDLADKVLSACMKYAPAQTGREESIQC
jgi:hypothetical protein